jgi:hypothetical protein
MRLDNSSGTLGIGVRRLRAIWVDLTSYFLDSYLASFTSF